MKIVAFLQNMWVLPHQVASVTRYDPTSVQRERMIHYSLFAGCLTGRRLKAALGEELCAEIVWQEASPVVDSNPKNYHAPDADHIRNVLTKHKPDVVVSFTRAGEKAIKSELGESVRFIAAVHPAARGGATAAILQEVRVALRTAMGGSADLVPIKK